MILISTLILLTSSLAFSSAKTSQLQPEGSLNSRSPTLCTTISGTKCVFPFTYQGIEHYVCTYADSPTPWCATEVQSNGTTIPDKSVFNSLWNTLWLLTGGVTAALAAFPGVLQRIFMHHPLCLRSPVYPQPSDQLLPAHNHNQQPSKHLIIPPQLTPRVVA